jgi:hypothetical protein
MQRAIIAALTATIIATPLFAAETQSSGAKLAPGKPAGIRKAQDQDSIVPYLILGGGLGVAIGLATTEGGSSATSPTATTTATTTTSTST